MLRRALPFEFADRGHPSAAAGGSGKRFQTGSTGARWRLCGSCGEAPVLSNLQDRGAPSSKFPELLRDVGDGNRAWDRDRGSNPLLVGRKIRGTMRWNAAHVVFL